MTAATETPTTELRIASPNGPVTRTILQTPLRDATPSEIPLIDISSTFSPSLKDRKAVASKIRDAATNTGFFYISRHGVPSAVLEAMSEAALSFFRQDMEKKMIADTSKVQFSGGYRPPDTQRINRDEGVDVKEAFWWRYHPRYDDTVEDEQSVPEEVMKHMHLDDHPWNSTAHLPSLKETGLEYFQAMLKLARALTRAFALSLDLPEDFFDRKVQYPDAALNLNYYPPIPTPKSPTDASARVSIGSHTDFQLFTILWQDLTGGLQVLSQSGQWLRARPVKDTFVVNIGDYMQRITNDRYASTVHRAQNWSGRERVSIPFFWGFGLHESCGVLDSCVGVGEVKKYEEIGCREWILKRLANMLSVEDETGGKGEEGVTT